MKTLDAIHEHGVAIYQRQNDDGSAGAYDRIAVDIAHFKDYSPEDAKNVIHNAVQQLDITNEDRSDLEKSILSAIENPSDLDQHGHGLVEKFGHRERHFHNDHTVTETFHDTRRAAIIDSDHISPSSIYDSFLHHPDGGPSASSQIHFSDAERAHNIEITTAHEAGHFFYDLNEPGADFMAAVHLLQKYPNDQELRDALISYADERLIQASLDHGNTKALNKYGAACHDAIMTALTLPLSELAHMTEDDIIEQATDFDLLNSDPNTYSIHVGNVTWGIIFDEDRNIDINNLTVQDLPTIKESAEAYLKDIQDDPAEAALAATLDSFIEAVERVIQRTQEPNATLKIDYQPIVTQQL